MNFPWGSVGQANPHEAIASPADSAHGMSAAELLKALWRKRNWIWVPTLVVAVLTYGYLINATSRYTSEARILVEDTQSVFAKTEREQDERDVDQAGIASHVQLLLARDLARAVIAELKLTQYDEFDPLKDGISLPQRLLIILGLAPDPHRMTEEERALREFADMLQVHQVDNSRVISVRFTSRNPQRAADVVNAVADHYIKLQQEARRQSTLQAATWLGSQVEEMRHKVEEAEAKVEAFRSANGLQRGSADAPLPNSQLSELNTRLSTLRAQHAEAKARARMIRDGLKRGGDLSSLHDVLNSQVIQRLIEQRVTLQRRIAELSSTLLSQHPRMRELNGELADLQRQIKIEAEKVIAGLENEAAIAAAREKAVYDSLDQLKTETGESNSSEVELRSLEREAKAQRQILETFLGRYREANARQAGPASPAEARIISRGAVSNEPSHPKKTQIFLIAVFATLLLSVACVLSGELMSQAAAEQEWLLARGFAAADQSGPREEPGQPYARAPAPAASAGNGAPAVMAARDVVAALLARRHGGDSLRVLVTSPQRMSERNFAALNLARLMTREGQKVIVVDANMRTPRLGMQLRLKDTRGLAELLHGECSFAEVIQRDAQSPVHAIAAGGNRNNMVTLFEADRLERVLDALEGSYGVIVVDAPPVLLTGEAQMLADHVDVAVVLRDDLPGGARLDERAANTLTQNGERPLKVVKAEAALADPAPTAPRPQENAA